MSGAATKTLVGLTRKQLELLNYIEMYFASEGVAPSYDEMRLALGLKSKSGIHRLITALEYRGHLVRLPDRARAITPISYVDAAEVQTAAKSKVDERMRRFRNEAEVLSRHLGISRKKAFERVKQHYGA